MPRRSRQCAGAVDLHAPQKGPLVRIITLNVNGIRSAERKGLASWLARGTPWDVVCLQEIRCNNDDIPRALQAPRRAHAAFNTAQRKGYSGVAVYSRKPPRV